MKGHEYYRFKCSRVFCHQSVEENLTSRRYRRRPNLTTPWYFISFVPYIPGLSQSFFDYIIEDYGNIELEPTRYRPLSLTHEIYIPLKYSSFSNWSNEEI